MDWQQRVRELEGEVRYLRHILDAHHISYEQGPGQLAAPGQLFVWRVITPEMARFFYSYFHGRGDVYSRRAKLKKGGFGYFPVCNNFWRYGICPKAAGRKQKCSECPYQSYQALSDRVLMSHLMGKRPDGTDVIGIYPLLPDNTCYFLVFDFDNHDGAEEDHGWQEDAGALRQVCQNCGVNCLVERSRSGRGAHVWIFFQEAIPAHVAREFGRALLRKGAESVSFKDFRSYDRMMPMQDYLKDGGLGNLIALPLQGQALLHGNSAFVDADWHVYPDQWKALAETEKLSLSQVLQKLQEWGEGEDFQKGPLPVSEKPWERKRSGFHREDAAGLVFITLSNGIYIEKQNLMPRLQNQLRRLAAFENPEFHKKFAMGYSTYDTPRIVYRGRDEYGYIYLPRGCLQDLMEKLNEGHVPFHLDDRRNKGKEIHVSFRGTLYPEQQAGVEEMLKYHTGILQAATAFGKTVVGAYLIAAKKRNALVLVQNTEILKNWQEDLPRFLTFQEEPPTYTTPSGRVKRRSSVIGTLQAGRDSLTGIVDIAMMGSLKRRTGGISCTGTVWSSWMNATMPGRKRMRRCCPILMRKPYTD